MFKLCHQEIAAWWHSEDHLCRCVIYSFNGGGTNGSDAGVQPESDAAGDDPEGDVRRL
jgi:hypothetical protein